MVLEVNNIKLDDNFCFNFDHKDLFNPRIEKDYLLDSSDNERNNRFKEQLESAFENKLLYALRYSEIPVEYPGDIELKLKDYLNQNRDATSNWLYQLCEKHLQDHKIIVNFLRLLGNLAPTDVLGAHYFVFGSFASKHIEIYDTALSVFEKWADKNSLKYLKLLRRLEPSWLEEYKQNIIKYIEGN